MSVTGSALAELTRVWDQPDVWAWDAAELRDVQLAAAQERFEERREQIRVLARRADDEGIERIAEPADLIPLLVSHTTYKSYPEAFIAKGRWDGMTKWMSTLSTQAMDGVDLDDVADVDDWIERLHAAGHLVRTSSGTTGRSSFMDHTTGDRAWFGRTITKQVALACGVEPGNTWRYFAATPSFGRTIAGESNGLLAELYGRPGGIRFLSDESIPVAELNRMGQLRRAMADGTANPEEIAAAQREIEARQERMNANLDSFVDDLIDCRSEPICLAAIYPQLWLIVQRARDRGVGDGEFDPSMFIHTGGGMKGMDAPADFKEQIRRFFGIPAQRFLQAYGMSELVCQTNICSEGAYHYLPTTIPLVLDKAGEVVLEPGADGLVEGRAAFMDLLSEGRWGGVISGDRVTVNFAPCACGRRSPSVVAIARYTDLPEGDDKLSCAGTMDAYIRGLL